MIHYLPPNLLGNFRGFEDLAILAEDARELFSNRLEVDFSRCASFDPNMAAPLGAVLADIDAYADEMLLAIAGRLGFADVYDRAVEAAAR